MCDSCFLTIFGWLVAMLTGICLAVYAERVRVLNGLRSKVMLIREDVERALDLEERATCDKRSIERVWEQALADLRQTVFAALPYLILCGERERLNVVWRELRDFDMREFYDRGTDEIVDRVILGQITVTKKQAILRTLSRLEQRIG